MAIKMDLTGQKFGRLEAIKRLPRYKKTHTYYLCKCNCGNETIVETSMLTSGHTRSCGCYRHEREREANTKHGKYGTRIYSTYFRMKQRCFDKNCRKYKNYGGRGITVCSEWLGENGFIHFYEWAITNGYADNLTIERIDVNGSYCPDNCTWIPMSEQAKNKTTNLRINYNGKVKILADWCRELNLPYKAVHARLMDGWSIERAFTQTTDRKKYYEYKGKLININDIAKITGFPKKTIKSRIDNKWDIDRIINQPMKVAN